MNEIINKLSYAIFPRRCCLCGEVIELDKKKCQECLNNLPVIEPPVCPFCGNNKDDCCCKQKKLEYKSIIAPFYYKDRVHLIINNFKNNDMPELSKEMAKIMADTFYKYYSLIDFDIITSVPLHKSTLKKRGFNQSELLAVELSKTTSITYNNYLYKVFRTKLQKRQSARERKVNIYGAYDLIDGVNVENKTILIVDDVKTTGSTLSECAKMLKINGAKEVYAIAFAITNRN